MYQDTGKAIISRDPVYSGFNRIVQVCVRGSDSFHLLGCATPRVLPLPMSNMAHLCMSQTTRKGKKTRRYASFSLRTRLRNCVSLLFTCLSLVNTATSSHSCLKFCLKFYVLLFMHSYLMYLALKVYVLLELFLFKKQTTITTKTCLKVTNTRNDEGSVSQNQMRNSHAIIISK